MQENDFNDSGAIILSLHHGGSINAQERSKQTKEPASRRWLLRLPQPLSSACRALLLSSVLGPVPLSASKFWDEAHARKPLSPRQKTAGPSFHYHWFNRCTRAYPDIQRTPVPTVSPTDQFPRPLASFSGPCASDCTSLGSTSLGSSALFCAWAVSIACKQMFG